MAEYKDIHGTTVRNSDGVFTGADTGELFYDSTNRNFSYRFPNVTSAGAWRTGGTMNTARIDLMGAGIQTSALGFGGEASPGYQVITESYNGSTWTEVADLSTAGAQGGASGASNTSALCFGRAPNTANTESWDGSSWTNISASPIVFNGGNHGGGTQTAGITYGPRTYNATELWDGTTWVTSAKYSTSRGGNCAGDASDGLLVGGYTGTANSNATEEFTGETTTARAVKTIDFD